jgi:hypothetical protein
MAGRGSQTFQKRQKELQRKERQEEKRAKRLQRKREPEGTDTPAEEGEGMPSSLEPDDSSSAVPALPTS